MNQIDRRSCSEDEGGETSAPAVEPQAGNVSLCRSRGHSNPVTRKVAQEVNMKTGAGQSTSVKQADVSSCSNSFLRLALVVFWDDGGCYQDESGESDEKETGGRCEFNHWNFADHCILNFPGKKKGQQGNGGPQGQFIETHPIATWLYPWLLQNPVRCRKATSKALASSKQMHWFGRAETGKLWRWENSIFSEGTGIEFFQLSRNVFRWSQMCPFCFVLCVIRILFQVAHHGWISGRKIYSVKLPLGRVQPLEWKVVGAQAFRVSNGFKCFVWCQHEQVSNNKTGGKKKSGAQLFVGEKVFRSFSSIR